MIIFNQKYFGILWKYIFLIYKKLNFLYYYVRVYIKILPRIARYESFYIMPKDVIIVLKVFLGIFYSLDWFQKTSYMFSWYISHECHYISKSQNFNTNLDYHFKRKNLNNGYSFFSPIKMTMRPRPNHKNSNLNFELTNKEKSKLDLKAIWTHIPSQATTI